MMRIGNLNLHLGFLQVYQTTIGVFFNHGARNTLGSLVEIVKVYDGYHLRYNWNPIGRYMCRLYAWNMTKRLWYIWFMSSGFDKKKVDGCWNLAAHRKGYIVSFTLQTLKRHFYDLMVRFSSRQPNACSIVVVMNFCGSFIIIYISTDIKIKYYDFFAILNFVYVQHCSFIVFNIDVCIDSGIITSGTKYIYKVTINII